MGNLLCVVREPASADNLINFSARLAFDLKSHVRFMYVEEEYEYTLGRPPAPEYFTGKEQSERIIEARRTLEERINVSLGEFRNEISHDFSAELTSLTSAIEEYSAANQPDLLLLETDEPSGLSIISPSNEELIGELNIPALLVPADAEYRSFLKIIYASAYSEKDLYALKRLIGLTLSLKPSIRIVHFTDDTNSGRGLESLAFADMIRKETGYTEFTLDHPEKTSENLSDQIQNYATAMNADLLVIMKEEMSFFEKIFRRDVTGKVIRNPDIPVLVYRI